MKKKLIEKEREQGENACHAYNTVQGSFVQGPPF